MHAPRTLGEAAEHIADRYPLLRDTDDARKINAIASTDYQLAWRDVAVRHTDDFQGDRPPASADDALAALRLLAALREKLDANERDLIDIARREKATWPQIASELGLSSPQAAQQRRKRLDSATRSDQFLDPERNLGARIDKTAAELDRIIAGADDMIKAADS